MKVEQIELLEHIFKVRPLVLPSVLRCLKTAPKVETSDINFTPDIFKMLSTDHCINISVFIVNCI